MCTTCKETAILLSILGGDGRVRKYSNADYSSMGGAQLQTFINFVLIMNNYV